MSRSSGLGSWPGTDARTAQRRIRDILTDTRDDARGGIPYLPELPDRGPGADMIGRSAALLIELPVDLQPSGWRLVDRPGRDVHRAQAFLRSDLDDLAETFDGYAGDLKVQFTGPWTLAAQLRLNRGERALSDPGAVRDLTASLAEGVRRHVADVSRLVPGASVVVQVDEPMLPDVLAGELATSSGFGRLRAIDPTDAHRGIAEVLAAAGDRLTVVHCCAAQPPLPVIRQAGPTAVSIDTGLLNASGWESVAATVESGVALWAGILPTDGRSAPSAASDAHHRLIAPLVRAWHEVGLPVADLDHVILTPACGLVGFSPDQARLAQQLVADAAGALTAAAQ